MGRYWLVLGGTGSVWGGTCWYLVVLGQYGVVLGQDGTPLHCLVLGGTESVCIAHRNLKWSYDQTVLLVWLESNVK